MLIFLDLSDELRISLIEQLFNERAPSDGETYRKIRQHGLKSLAAARWWARVIKNKRYEMKRLLRRDSGLRCTIGYSGSVAGRDTAGVTKDMIDLKCDEVGHLFDIL